MALALDEASKEFMTDSRCDGGQKSTVQMHVSIGKLLHSHHETVALSL